MRKGWRRDLGLIQLLICDDEERFFYYDKKEDMHILPPISRLLAYLSSLS